VNSLEKNLVKLVAKIAPWLAPFPSAFFVARASITHLALPLGVAVVVAAIIETLGLSTVHTALWLADWNASKRKSDPKAPVALAIALGIVYIVTTVGLTVVLEVAPSLATYAPAMFPALAVVGGVNLALISRQERRETAVKRQKAERKTARQSRKKTGTRPARTAGTITGASGTTREAAMVILAERPGISGSELGRRLGRSERLGRNLKAELLPVIADNGNGVVVKARNPVQ